MQIMIFNYSHVLELLRDEKYTHYKYTAPLHDNGVNKISAT